MNHGHRYGSSLYLASLLLASLLALVACGGAPSGTAGSVADSPAETVPPAAADDKCSLLTQEEAAATGATGPPRPGTVANQADCSWIGEGPNNQTIVLELAAIRDQATADRVWQMYIDHTQPADGPPGTRVGTNDKNVALIAMKGEDRLLLMTGKAINQATLTTAFTAAYERL